jgi:hypothetical protein
VTTVDLVDGIDGSDVPPAARGRCCGAQLSISRSDGTEGVLYCTRTPEHEADHAAWGPGRRPRCYARWPAG